MKTFHIRLLVGERITVREVRASYYRWEARESSLTLLNEEEDEVLRLNLRHVISVEEIPTATS